MNASGYCQELSKYEDLDEDDLLASLTPEEIQELEKELSEIDPDDKVPNELRKRDQTTKTPTGTFSQEGLLKYWESETRKLFENESPQDCENKEKDECVTENIREESEKHKLEKETCVCKSNNLKEEEEEEEEKKEEEEEEYNEEEYLDDTKKENYIVKFSPLRNPYNDRQTFKSEKPVKSSSLDPGLLVQELSQMSGNPTAVDRVLEQICADDPFTTEVNLNNIDNISQELLILFAEALQSNTHVRVFSLANTRADDRVAFAISKMLGENFHITNLNIESNYITGKGILALVKALAHNSTLTELRFHNQRHICGGQVEMEIVKLLRENTTLLKLGYQFDLPGPRMSITGILTRNQDRQRQKRMQEQRQQSTAVTPINPRTGTLEKITITSPYSSPLGSPLSHSKQLHKDVVKQNESSALLPPLPFPPALHIAQSVPEMRNPSRKIAEVIKLHEVSAKRQQPIAQGKFKSKKEGNMGKETASIVKELKNTLKPIADNYSRPSTPQHSAHDDLMAAIRASSIKSLRRVEVPPYPH